MPVNVVSGKMWPKIHFARPAKFVPAFYFDDKIIILPLFYWRACTSAIFTIFPLVE